MAHSLGASRSGVLSSSTTRQSTVRLAPKRALGRARHAMKCQASLGATSFMGTSVVRQAAPQMVTRRSAPRAKTGRLVVRAMFERFTEKAIKGEFHLHAANRQQHSTKCSYIKGSSPLEYLSCSNVCNLKGLAPSCCHAQYASSSPDIYMLFSLHAVVMLAQEEARRLGKLSYLQVAACKQVLSVASSS